MRLPGGVLQVEQHGGARAHLQRALEDQADPGGAGVDQATVDVVPGREALRRRVALEAVDEASLPSPADDPERAQHAA